MEILKQLNLNGNPQTVPNGSLVYAKNIKLSDDGTYITNDDGFSTAFATQGFDEEDLKVKNIAGDFVEAIESQDKDYTVQKLVGYINCPNEVVLFVYKEYEEDEKVIGISEIYRAVELNNSDKLALYKVPTGWKYDGGTIIGTYTYTVYNHLIVAISEYNSNVDKQILTIDLNDSSKEDSINKYSCAPNIPICNLNFINKVKGNPMPHGIYYFFIRYEISDKIYTNWFPIGAPQYALSLDYKTIINHIYPKDDSADRNLGYTNVSALVNSDKDSYYNFAFIIEFNNSYNYKNYQIGYILQTEDTAVGRIWKNFSFDDGIAKSFTFNGGYIEEISLDDLSRNVLNVYNVKALTNYNNRLYISNFKETNYNLITPEIQECVDKIKAVQVKRKVNTSAEEKEIVILNTWTYTINEESVSITVPSDVSTVLLTNYPDLVRLLANNMSYKSFGTEFTGEGYTLTLSQKGVLLNPSTKYTSQAGSSLHFSILYTGPLDDKYFVWDGTSTNYDSYVFGGADYKGLIRSEITIELSTGMEEHKVYNYDNTIRTLMPHEVYAFYVHYVREDGSFTNGYPLNNTLLNLGDTYKKRVRELTETELDFLHLEDISTIEEIKDKYVYELCYLDNTRPDNLTEEFFPYYAESGRILFKTGSGAITIDGTTYLLRIGVEFYNITYPKGFVGCFFSYEKVRNLSVYQAVVTDQLDDVNNSILCKANDVESSNVRYDGTLFVPHHKVDLATGNIENVNSEPKHAYINNASPVLSNGYISFLGSIVDRTGLHGGIAMNLSKSYEEGYQPTEYIVGNIITFDRAIYSEENKELVPFGPISVSDTYGEDSTVNDTNINHNMNYPSFLVKDNLLIYADRIAIDEALRVHELQELTTPNSTHYVVDGDIFYNYDTPYAKMNSIWKFSNVNLLALTIKKEPEDKAGVLAYNDDDDWTNAINTIVEPINASDLFKLESCYIPKIHKAYTNYNRLLVQPEVFTNIIRASYPIRNESNINNWRFLDPLAYHVIDNINGDVINIFGAGKAFYIHTRNNLLVTSKDAKLSAEYKDVNVKSHDIFDIEPNPLFTSDLGYGGIKHQQCQLFSQLGYIWYDTDRYKLFRFDNGHLVDINSGLDEILKKYKYEYCYITIDNETNRVFFAFKSDGIYDLTLSYDTLGNKWLSVYDFSFDKDIHTINNALFSLNEKTEVYKYSKDADYCDYLDFYSFNLDLPNYGSKDENDDLSIVKYCCFDVIFNSEYVVSKVLDNIRWAHEIIKRNTLNKKHPAQFELIYDNNNDNIYEKVEDLNGMFIDIYTDSVDTGLLSLKPDKINDVANVNNPNNYKYPYYDKGVWNYNYFRNNIAETPSEEEIRKLAELYEMEITTLNNVYKTITKDGTIVYRLSDLRSLIYGKYIVVRFVFKVSNKVKFDNLVVNIKPY